jgi:hypothetical protein
LYGGWLLLIAGFAAVHAVHLRADFPNHSPWVFDWAKYTDEGWYGNAAIRAHLFGHWYLPGDFNPAPAVPLWPFLEWVLFFFTGVTIQAARGLAVGFFFANLLLTWLLLKGRGPKWMPLLALTLLVTSPFLYSFSRLAILEPMLTTLMLAAMNLAVRLKKFRRPMTVSLGIGLLFTLMLLTKTTAVFLLPALLWCMVWPVWKKERKRAIASALAAAVGAGVSFGFWMLLVVRAGLLADYKYLFFVNRYPKPKELYWPAVSLWWCVHGTLWVDHILIPLAGLLVVGAFLLRRSHAGRRLLLDPVFVASLLAVGGYILFMAVQDHPQPRYYAVVAWFSFMMVAQGLGALVAGAKAREEEQSERRMSLHRLVRVGSGLLVGVAGLAAGINGVWTMDYVVHPEYTFVTAAEQLTKYIDAHPNGKRLLITVSGDEITLVTHLPTLNDLFVSPDANMPDLAAKLAYYRPGWYATWNELDVGALEDLHSVYSVEQVAKFRAYDSGDRDVLVLFKLHPWADGRVRDPADEKLQQVFPEDKIEIPVE